MISTSYLIAQIRDNSIVYNPAVIKSIVPCKLILFGRNNFCISTNFFYHIDEFFAVIRLETVPDIIVWVVFSESGYKIGDIPFEVIFVCNV